METQVCNVCGIEKELDEFYKAKGVASGRQSTCKECRKKLRKEYYQQNKKKEIERGKEYYKKHEERLRKLRMERYYNKR